MVLTQDWHPRGHLSFASSHPGKKPYQTIELAYGVQVLWPDHCMQGTAAPHCAKTWRFPTRNWCCVKAIIARSIYSAFYENDRKTQTGLAGYLRERDFRRVFLAGLAFDFCVRYSAEDARREGFEAIVIEDACRGIDIDGSMAATRELFRALGIRCISANAIEARADPT